MNADTKILSAAETESVAEQAVFRPKIGRAPWQTAPIPVAAAISGAAPSPASKGEWDTKIALALIALIIAVNVGLMLLLSSDATPVAQKNVQETLTAEDRDAIREARPAAWSNQGREELLSIIGKY